MIKMMFLFSGFLLLSLHSFAQVPAYSNYYISYGEETCLSPTAKCTQAPLHYPDGGPDYVEIPFEGGHPDNETLHLWRGISEQAITTSTGSYFVSVKIDQLIDEATRKVINVTIRIQIFSGTTKALLAQAFGPGGNVALTLPEQQLVGGGQKSFYVIVHPPTPHPGTTGSN